MPKSNCIEGGCEKPIRCMGRCAPHYARWIKLTPKSERPRPTDAERFWAKVKPGENGCLLWMAGADVTGYGRFYVGRRIVLAHRWALEDRLGRLLAAGKFACHTCDTPACVNPDHLYEGDDQENVDDMIGKLRHAFGERNGHHKLTADEVATIRRLAPTLSQRELAARFGVAQSTISRIIGGKRWRLVVEGQCHPAP